MIEKKISSLEGKLKIVRQRIESGERLVLFGAGEKAKGVVNILEKNNIQIFCFCDNDLKKQQDGYLGYCVKDLKDLQLPVFFIVCTAINFFAEIKMQLREWGNVDIYHMCTPFRVEDVFLEYQTICQHHKEYDKLYEMFQDEHSRELFLKCLTYKINGDAEELLNIAENNNLFDSDIINSNINHTYIDCGAFTGDTLIQFCLFCQGKYKEIIAIEADRYNCECIRRLVEYARLDNCCIIDKGCWENSAELKFYTYETMNQTAYENGDLCSLNKNSRASINSQKLNESVKIEKIVKVDTVDNMVAGKLPTLIKINTVSADFQTLKGCSGLMKRYQPTIIIELGTRPGDILAMPNLIKEINPNYKLYLRQKKVFLDSKTILYAV